MKSAIFPQEQGLSRVSNLLKNEEIVQNIRIFLKMSQCNLIILKNAWLSHVKPKQKRDKRLKNGNNAKQTKITKETNV